ncbi:MAG: CinA family nicotinamide mononucleotide deamidase-related protein [Thermodesulfobacteria bacterium]|nr:CinA family nicotinamide mononucleotide deamidase-related protein [Thermodesulfobacteriota bacterium]
MRGAILAIGNELVEGRVPNTTSFLAARRLFPLGYEIREILTVPDDLALIKESLRRFLGRYPFVIVSGGLGPTTDDLTNEAVAEALGLPLEVKEEVLKRIEAWEKEAGLPPNPLRRKMAKLPAGAVLLTNEKAMAGYYLKVGEKLIFCLPGVPQEFEYLLKERVIPILLEHFPPEEVVRFKLYKIFGLREADINLRLMELEELPGVVLGYYPVLPEIHLSLTVKHPSKEKAEELFRQAEAKIYSLFGEYIFGENDDLLEAVVGRLLEERGEMLAVAESCTGGLISSRITRVPGSSAYFERGVVTYSNRAKQEILGVPEEMIAKHGAVSEPVALAMAEGIRNLARTNYGLSVTGIAGPTGGTPEKPAGTVWIGFSCREATVAQCFLFPGDRHLVQDFSATTALDWLRRYLRYGTLVPRYQFARRS